MREKRFRFFHKMFLSLFFEQNQIIMTNVILFDSILLSKTEIKKIIYARKKQNTNQLLFILINRFYSLQYTTTQIYVHTRIYLGQCRLL